MASLIETLLGAQSPVTQWTQRNSNLLTGLGTSLLSDGMNFQPAQQGAVLDQEKARQKEADAKLVASKNATKTWLAQNFPDLAQAVDAGLPISDAWQEAFKRQQPGYGELDPTANMRDFAFAQANPGFAEFLNPTASADAPTVQTRFNPDTGREEKVVWNPQKGGWDAFGGQKAVNSAGDLSATETRQLFETEDAIAAGQNVVSALDTALSLNDRARSGWGAELSANVGANLPDWVPLIGGNSSDADTLQLKNIVTEQALSQLKLVFGGNPTEGERQILLDIQGSVNQPADVRKRIFDRAKELALTRIKFNEQRKAKIESGGYGVVNGGTRTGGNYTVVKVE